ncbi:hypothetical protein Hanom_Chr12g01120021 [Helianthus anomalus]
MSCNDGRKEERDWLLSHLHGGTETMCSCSSSPSTLRLIMPPPNMIFNRPTFHPRQAF